MTRFSRGTGLLLLTTLLLIPAHLYSTPFPQSAGDVRVSGSIAPDKVKRGRTAQGSVVMEIPSGLHVQSNRPLDKFLVATKLEIEAPQGLRVGAVLYPHTVLRNLKVFQRARGGLRRTHCHSLQRYGTGKFRL